MPTPQNNPHSSRFSAIAFLIILLLFAAGSIVFTLSENADWESHSEDSDALIRGKTTAAFEKHYEDHLPYSDAAVATWGAVRYGVFNTGSKGAVIGKDGWLYTSEEFKLELDYSQYFEQNLASVSQTRAFLASHGISLLIAMVPAKSRIYPEHLGAAKRPEAWQEIYSTISSELKSKNGFLDLTAPLKKAKHTKQVFMARDTHWSPAGAYESASSIAEKISMGCPNLLDEKKPFYSLKQPTAMHKGDLTDFVPTGITRPLLGPEDEKLSVYTTELKSGNAAGGAAGLFDEPEIPVALIGTSYSAHDEWHFEGFLKETLQSDVLSLADEGGGPLAPMAKFLTETDFTNSTLKIVIWEFPERFFPVDYSQVEWPEAVINPPATAPLLLAEADGEIGHLQKTVLPCTSRTANITDITNKEAAVTSQDAAPSNTAESAR